MKNNEFQCSACKNIYEKGWTDEEAVAENEALYGDKSISSGEPQEVVCDDCFTKLKELTKPKP